MNLIKSICNLIKFAHYEKFNARWKLGQKLMKYSTITCVRGRGRKRERERGEVAVSVIEWLNEHVCVCVVQMQHVVRVPISPWITNYTCN